MVRRAAFAVLFVSASLFAAEPTPAPSLDAPSFQALAASKKGLVLDVRTPGEVARGRLAGASVIDLYDPKFDQKLSLLPRERPIFVYCGSGVRSAQAAEKMQALGFKEVYNLAGGMRAWNAAGLPVETPAEPAAASGGGLEPKALDAALKASRRVLVDYQTPWCAPCQKMLPLVDALAQGQKGLKVLKVDVDESEALVAREKIVAVPALVLYVDGKERRRSTGELTREALEKWVTQP